MSTYQNITIEESKAILSGHNARLIDIRDHESFERGHIPKAEHLTLDSLNDFMSEAPKDLPYIIYCYHGNSSQRVAKVLCENGFNAVYSLVGGYGAWEEEGLS